MDNDNKFQNNKIKHIISQCPSKSKCGIFNRSSSSIKLFECLEFLQHATVFTFETQNSNIQIVPNRDQKHHDILTEKAYKITSCIIQ